MEAPVKHHVDFEAVRRAIDADTAGLVQDGTACRLCGDTGLAGYTPCVCPAGRRLVAEYDDYRGAGR